MHSHLHPKCLMEKSGLLQQSQTQPPGHSTVAAQGDQGTRLNPWDAVDILSSTIIGDLIDGGGGWD